MLRSVVRILRMNSFDTVRVRRRVRARSRGRGRGRGRSRVTVRIFRMNSVEWSMACRP